MKEMLRGRFLTDKGRIPWQAFCRGGGNVDQTESDLLQGLKDLLVAHSSPRQSKGKGKTHSLRSQLRITQKGKGKSKAPKSQLRIATLARAKGTVAATCSKHSRELFTRAEKSPGGLLQRLGTLVNQTTSGKNLRPTRADRRARAKGQQVRSFG